MIGRSRKMSPASAKAHPSRVLRLPKCRRRAATPEFFRSRRFVACLFTTVHVNFATLNEYSFSQIVAGAGVAEKNLMRDFRLDRSVSRTSAGCGR